MNMWVQQSLRVSSRCIRPTSTQRLGLHRPCLKLNRWLSSTSAPAEEDAPAAFKAPAVNEVVEPQYDEIFHCDGIEASAVQMRRRVQLGIFLEVAGTHVSNFMYRSSWEDYVHAMNTFFFENSAILLAVHCAIVWKYHSFLRDALLARHVTRIATVTPQTMENVDPDTCSVAVIETGPWARHIQLKRLQVGTGGDEVDKHGSQVPFGQLLQLGVLHADRRRGSVIDPGRMENLLNGNLMVGSEEVTTDISLAGYAFVDSEKMMPFLADSGVSSSTVSDDSVLGKLQKNEWINKVAQLPGGKMMDYYGNLALAMGVGTVVVWTLPEDYLKKSFKVQGMRRHLCGDHQ